ncbi:LysR family transcriptional regulator [Tabrizicola soli]|uniref:LysR family transcriptional regulator n=1 Tax=Tabrizicola soli TaxID=2185115 RepID=A0ABV7DXL6_9RHOB|nr:LysR family transcriptional regulator [Tabrizicola soli]
MIAPRRFLPSISSLLALEAVDRLGSATAAADELALTHSAVSRQLKALQDQIGVTLLRREGKGLALTPAGIDYAASIRDYLQDLARASLKIRAAGERTSLNIAVLPAFGTHWLLPRLRDFAEENPDTIINLGTRLSPFDFTREPFDAAIHFGNADWPGAHHLELARESVIPACAPGLVPLGALAPRMLQSLPLLHLESRPGAWEDWFARHGCPADHLRGMLFDQFAQMAEAAALGFGVALLPRFLAEAEFRAGRLRPAVEGFTEVDGAYHIVWPRLWNPSRPLQKLLKWLQGGAAA